MTSFNLNVSEPWLTYLVSGEKQIEGRINKGKFSLIKKGDLLELQNGTILKVICIRRYFSFKNMLIYEGLDKVLPGTSTIDDGISIYRQYYSIEDEKKSVLAFHVERM
jgi:ASC-1-like (ASCH) protein